LTFSVISFPNQEMHQRMRDTAERIGLPSTEALADG
jgi:hypothetical protein